MNEIVLSAIVSTVTAACSAAISFLAARKKYKADVSAVEINNFKESLDFYITLSNDNKDRLDSFIDERATLMAKIDSLKEENESLKLLVAQQSMHIKELTEQVKTLSEKLDKTKKK